MAELDAHVEVDLGTVYDVDGDIAHVARIDGLTYVSFTQHRGRKAAVALAFDAGGLAELRELLDRAAMPGQAVG